MKCLEDVASKWHRIGGSWSPALWPSGAPDVGEPVPPAGVPIIAPAWMPYPAPRIEVVRRATTYLSTWRRGPVDPQMIDCRGLGRVGYEERRAAIRVVQAWHQAVLSAFMPGVTCPPGVRFVSLFSQEGN